MAVARAADGQMVDCGVLLSLATPRRSSARCMRNVAGSVRSARDSVRVSPTHAACAPRLDVAHVRNQETHEPGDGDNHARDDEEKADRVYAGQCAAHED